MVAHRAYWPGLAEPPNGRASLLYFAAAMPTVGMALLTSTRSMRRRSRATQRPVLSTGRDQWLLCLSPHGGGLWACDGLPKVVGADGGPSFRLSARRHVRGLAFRTGREAHGKHRAFARLARHGHVAAHHPRKLAGDGKARCRCSGVQ